MPTSHLYQLNEIIELIFETKPKTILDIGIGFGKFGFLSREYLDIWGRESHDYRSRDVRIDGIEVFKEYLTPVHNFIYDNIFIGNAIDVLPTLKIRYDLILLIDVLEHFNFKEGEKIISECIKRGRNIIISTPLNIGNQGPSRGNIYESHKFQWRKKHFNTYPKKFFRSNKLSIICFLGDDYIIVKNKIKINRSKIRSKLKKYYARVYKSVFNS